MPRLRPILEALRPLLLIWAAMLVAGLASGVAEAVAAPISPDEARALCGPARPGERCAAGAGRRTPGGGEKVSHAGWPAITGILWKVEASHDAARVGGEQNDELLGHHGSDRIAGGAGRDVLWGDWDPKGNGTRQRDLSTAAKGPTGSTRRTGTTCCGPAPGTTSCGRTTGAARSTAAPGMTPCACGS